MNCKLRMAYRKWEEHNEEVRLGIEDIKWMDMEENEKINRAEQEANLKQI